MYIIKFAKLQNILYHIWKSQVNANPLQISINHTNINTIIAYSNFNFASLTVFESFHHKIRVIQVYMKINKAEKNITISSNQVK